jgi:dTDP-L-rhamnose 4-epimerase
LSKIVVTGGMGFIGGKLARRLLGDGHEVRIVDSLTPQIHGEVPTVEVPEGAEFLRLDVRELAERHEVLEGSDAVVHLAAETGTAQSMYRIRHYVDVNEGGTAALLEGIARCERRPGRIVLASSRSVYGEGAYRNAAGEIVQPQPRTKDQLDKAEWEPRDADGQALSVIATPESLPFAPGSVYAATKASQELLLQTAAGGLGVTPVILRFQNVYGEGQSLQNPYTGIISIFFNRARQGLGLPIYEDGEETRDFVHVDDVTAAIVASLDPRVAGGAICNVGSGIATSVRTLAEKLAAAAGFAPEIKVTGQFRVGDIRHNFADIAAAREILGWEPKVGLDEGLARFCAWAASQPTYEDGLDRATAELRAKGLAN